MRHAKQAPRPLQLFVMKGRHRMTGSATLCLLCDPLVTVCRVAAACLTGDGGLPWTSADENTCFLSRLSHRR